jgi:uncharacterized protein (TIRG00374 family)
MPMSDLSPVPQLKPPPRFRKLELFLLILGVCALGYLVQKFGISTLIENLAATGWTFGVIIGVWLIIYLLNTSAWKLVLGHHAESITFPRLFRITVSAFALNDVTPMLGIGGEPYRIAVVSESLGRSRSVSAVTLYRMIFTLGHMSLLCVGIVIAIVAVDLPSSLKLLLMVLGVVLLSFILVLLSGHRRGVFERVYRGLQRIPLLRRLLQKIPVHPDSLKRMDELITNAYHDRKRDFYGAVGCEFLGRCCMGIEIYLILRSVGLQVDIAQAIFLYLTYSILINVLSAVPYNIGVREGGFYLAMGSMALPPMIGVYLGIVMRIREFFWILIGLIFIALASFRKPKVT